MNLLSVFLFLLVTVEGLRLNPFDGFVSERQQIFYAIISNLGDNPTNNALYSIVVESVSMKNTTVPVPDIPIFMFASAEKNKLNKNFNLSFNSPWISEEELPKVSVKDEFVSDDIAYYFGDLNTSQFNKENENIEVLATLKVKKNGLYLVYIKIPEEVEELHIRERITNSYGYLPYEVYKSLHWQLIYCIILTLLIGLMGRTYFKYGRSTDKNNESVAIIFKCFFWFVYLPYYFSTLIRLGFHFYFNTNELVNLYEDQLLLHILDWVDHIITITERYVFFLLASGYGSIYNGPSPLHTKVPTKSWYMGLILYLANFVSFSLLRRIDMFVNKRNFIVYFLVEFILGPIDFIFLAMWMILNVVHFFGNLKNLGKNSHGGVYSDQYIEKLARSYKMSIIPIFVLPLLMRTIDTIMTIIYLFTERGSDPLEGWEILQEGEYYKQTYDFFPLALCYVEKLSCMIFIYFYWMDQYVGMKPLSGAVAKKQIKTQ